VGQLLAVALVSYVYFHSTSGQALKASCTTLMSDTQQEAKLYGSVPVVEWVRGEVNSYPCSRKELGVGLN